MVADYPYPSSAAREEAWALADILALMGHPAAATWDSTLRALEDEYVSAEIWNECVKTMRELAQQRIGG